MKRMPVLFVGHGSPMNAIEANEFTNVWEELGKSLPKPKAILAISAHWYTRESKTNDMREPTLIYDMYGFPDALYQVQYPVKGAPEFAHQAMKLCTKKIDIDKSWGIDHGTWSVLVKMFPEADIPVYQLSIDRDADLSVHYQMGEELRKLREEGVLIMGSGNIVHNLRMIDWNNEGGFEWADTFDQFIKEKIMERDDDAILNYKQVGEPALLSVPTLDHFLPLLYVLGAADKNEHCEVFNEACVLGSLSMTGYIFRGHK